MCVEVLNTWQVASFVDIINTPVISQGASAEVGGVSGSQGEERREKEKEIYALLL